jgi:serine/threonine protein kinase
VERLLAEGGFAYVFLATDEGNNSSYALKKVLAQEKEQVAAAQAEIDILKALPKSEYIIKLIGKLFLTIFFFFFSFFFFFFFFNLKIFLKKKKKTIYRL